MSKIRVAVWGTTGKSVAFDPNATVGAQIGVNLLMPDGSVATLTKLISAIDSTSTSGSSSGTTAHRLLSGLALGDDHPQYTRRDILTTRGDLYVEGASALTRLAVGTNHQVLMSNGTDPGWVTLFANPSASVGLAAVNGTASTAMRSDGAPALDQAIAPTWTGQHTFSLTPLVGAVKVVLESRQVIAGSGLTGGGSLTGDVTLTLDHGVFAAVAFSGAYSDLSGTPTIPTDIHNATFLTSGVEAGLPNSREVLAGTNVTFDDTVPGQRTINATGGGGSGTVTSVSITAPAAGITQSGSPVTTSGAITLALANDLAALEGLGSTGIAVRSGTDTWVQRTIVGTANRIAVTNGDGVSANPTLDIDAAYVGQSSITTLGTVTTGVWHGTAIDLASYSTGILPAASFPTLTGDVTTAGGALATTIAANAITSGKIAANAVTLAKLATQADQTILGNNTGGTAVPLALTAAQVRTLLGLAAVATSGSASDLGTGTLPAAAFPTLSGDVTTAGGALATTIAANAVTSGKIAANAVTLAKLATQADQTILGNNTGGAAVPLALTAAQVRTILGLAAVATSGSASDLGTGTLPAAAFPTLTGDVTTAGGALATTIAALAVSTGKIAASAVTYAKIQNVSATSRVLGRITAGAGVVEELTAANISTILGLVAIATSGSATDLSTGTLPAGRFPALTGDVTTVAGALATTIGTTGTYTGTLTGCTTSPTITVRWVKTGSLVTLSIPGVSATSNTTACTITGALPANCQPTTTKWSAVPLLLNNGSANLSGTAASVGAGTSTITLANGGSSTGFTASGLKGVSSEITFTYDIN